MPQLNQRIHYLRLRINEAKTCDFCARTGHTIDNCYKFEAAKQLATAPSPHVKGKAEKNPSSYKASANPPSRPTAFFSYRPDDGDDPRPCTKLWYQACTYDTRSELRDNQLVLDTGANASIIKNGELLSHIKPSKPTEFGGIGGTITAKEQGQLYDIGPAFYSQDSPANILSCSQVREEGNTITLVPHNT